MTSKCSFAAALDDIDHVSETSGGGRGVAEHSVQSERVSLAQTPEQILSYQAKRKLLTFEVL